LSVPALGGKASPEVCFLSQPPLRPWQEVFDWQPVAGPAYPAAPPGRRHLHPARLQQQRRRHRGRQRHLPASRYGGAGNDRLKGGCGPNVLLGGARDDLLVGGTGADRLVGNAKDDILIAGTTPFDGNSNEAALAAIMAEWTRTDDPVEQGRTGGPELGITREVIDEGVGIHEDRRARREVREDHGPSGGGG
jgi:hypothetical protein